MGCALCQQAKRHKKVTKDYKGYRYRLRTVDCRRKETKFVDTITENVQVISDCISNQQVQFCMQALSKHHLFQSMKSQALRKLSQGTLWMRGKQGQYLFHQGEIGHSFFVIQKGTVSIEIDGKTIAEIKEGECFGQIALLCRTKRSASVKCLQQDTTFFVIRPSQYRAILDQMRTSETSLNLQVIQRISLFQSLSNKQKYNLAHLIKRINFEQGDIIYSQRSVPTGLYIVSQGQIQIKIPGKNKIKIGQLQVFGENALKQQSRREQIATCIEDSVCLVIGKADVTLALGDKINNIVFYNIQKRALLQTQVFRKYSNKELDKIIMGFSCLPMEDGRKMQGIRYRGIVIALEGGVNNLPQGSLFNLKKWVMGDQQGQNLIKNEAGHISYIPFTALNDLVQQIDNKQSLFRASQKCIQQRDDQFNLSDLQIVRKLGQGTFGQVFLVRSKKTAGGLYALKCLSKKQIIVEQMAASVIEEKRVLQKAIFPFIVGFVKAFHDKKYIFLLLQYLKGTQMFAVLRQILVLSKYMVCYFFGCILLSIQYLHANNIIYRDIKPQNSVIDHKGKVHLIDLGTAKYLKSADSYKTSTIIGTPHYMAPEVFQGKGYSFEADLWSLGILLYELVCMQLPFGDRIVDDDPYKIYKTIKKSQLNFPQSVQDEKTKDLIKFILLKDPKVRRQKVTFQKIKKHQFFQGFSWEALLSEKLIPPYIPKAFEYGQVQQKQQIQPQPFLKYFYPNSTAGTVTQWNQKI